jgi:hypothetical protein
MRVLQIQLTRTLTETLPFIMRSAWASILGLTNRSGLAFIPRLREIAILLLLLVLNHETADAI